MKRSVVGIIIAVVAIGAIIGVVVANNQDDGQNKSGSQQAATNSNSMADMNHSEDQPHTNDEVAPAGENEVNIVDFNFSPETLTIKKGTTVTWTNQDEARHDVTPDEPGEAFQGSELLAKGETYSFTFDTVGTYSYYCSPHPYMKATVEVTE